MKNGFKILCVMALILMTTGCVKIEIGMDINKDKSMNLSIIEAANKELLEQSDGDIADESELEQIKKEGFKVEKYEDDSMRGYKFTKQVNNIDTISTEDKVVGDLSVNSDNKKENEYLFTVKKGLFKNTYSAILESSDANTITDQAVTNNEENTDETNTEENYTENENTTIDGNIIDESIDENITIDENTTDESIDESFSQDKNLEQLAASGMQMNFTVNLPYKAINNNATKVDNYGQTLTWNLLDNEGKNIEFEFELYNMTNIYIAIGIGALLIIIIIILIIKKIKGKKKPLETNSVVEQLNSVKPADIENMPSQPNSMNISGTVTNITETTPEPNTTTKETITENNIPEENIEVLDIEETHNKDI